jgi:hypothetical protein
MGREHGSERVGAETVVMPDLEASGEDRKNAYTIVPEGGISRYSELQHDTALA